MGLYQVESIQKQELHDILTSMANQGEQPPFKVDIRHPGDISTFFLNGEYDWNSLVNNPDKLRAMTNLDHLIVIDSEALSKMELSEPFWLFKYDQEKVKAWLEENHPDILEIFNETDILNTGSCLESDLIMSLHRGGPAFAMSYNGNNEDGTLANNPLRLGIVVFDEESTLRAMNDLEDVNINRNGNLFGEEIGAMVLFHELEHAVGQSELTKYFDEIYTFYKSPYIQELLPKMSSHCGEIEADIAICRKLENLVSEESLDTFANIRIARHFYYQMAYPEHFNGFLATHDTGFFIKEFQETGDIPNYFQMCSDLKDFYSKTRFVYGELFLKEVGQECDFTNTPTLNVMADIVRMTMNFDPAIYTPEQQQLAFYYLDAIQSLGAELEPAQEHFQEVKLKLQENEMKPVFQNHNTPTPELKH